jgi:hypothetical protein
LAGGGSTEMPCWQGKQEDLPEESGREDFWGFIYFFIFAQLRILADLS